MHNLKGQGRTDWQSVLRFLGATALLISLSGCNRHDTDALARIGQRIAVHTRRNADEMSAKLELPWKDANKEPTLRAKIESRLRWDSALTECKFEIQTKEKEVELKGSVKTDEQRQRAIDLAQTVVGVDKVIETI